MMTVINLQVDRHASGRYSLMECPEDKPPVPGNWKDVTRPGLVTEHDEAKFYRALAQYH